MKQKYINDTQTFFSPHWLASPPPPTPSPPSRSTVPLAPISQHPLIFSPSPTYPPPLPPSLCSFHSCCPSFSPSLANYLLFSSGRLQAALLQLRIPPQHYTFFFILRLLPSLSFRLISRHFPLTPSPPALLYPLFHSFSRNSSPRVAWHFICNPPPPRRASVRQTAALLRNASSLLRKHASVKKKKEKKRQDFAFCRLRSFDVFGNGRLRALWVTLKSLNVSVHCVCVWGGYVGLLIVPHFDRHGWGARGGSNNHNYNSTLK